MTANTLHLFRQSPYRKDVMSLCLETLQAGDGLVLLDDGCYLLTHPSLPELSARSVSIYIINEHQNARALESNSKVEQISYSQLTELIFNYKNSVTWS